MLLSIGEQVLEVLEGGVDAKVSIIDLWRNVEQGKIPSQFFEEFSDDNTDEIGEYLNIKEIKLLT